MFVSLPYRDLPYHPLHTQWGLWTNLQSGPFSLHSYWFQRLELQSFAACLWMFLLQYFPSLRYNRVKSNYWDTQFLHMHSCLARHQGMHVLCLWLLNAPFLTLDGGGGRGGDLSKTLRVRTRGCGDGGGCGGGYGHGNDVVAVVLALLTIDMSLLANKDCTTVRKTGRTEDWKINSLIWKWVMKRIVSKTVLPSFSRAMSFAESVKFSWIRTLLTLICRLVWNGRMSFLILWCNSHLLGSKGFLLLWRPSMMEKELAGSCSSSSYRQWAAVKANKLPIWKRWNANYISINEATPIWHFNPTPVNQSLSLLHYQLLMSVLKDMFKMYFKICLRYV